jgi:hypothetical protein
MKHLRDARAAREQLGVSAQRLRDLDSVLAPVRLGRLRLYDARALTRYCAARDAKRAAR